MTEIVYSEVLKYLPKFEAGDFANANEHYKEKGCDSQQILDFMSTLINAGFQVSFDWTSWKKEAKRYFESPDLIASADLNTIQKLITTFIRQDRFSGGHFSNLCSSGIFVHILRRVHELNNE